MEQEKKTKGRLQHANELRRQVRENQQKQVQSRIATFEEGRRLKEEAQKRRERIEEIKKQKLEELRCAFSLCYSPLPQRGGAAGWESCDWVGRSSDSRCLVGGLLPPRLALEEGRL